MEEDDRLQPFVKDGRVFWQPPQDNSNLSINSYYRWEQAFKVYSNVYTKAYPQRGSELIQYSHDIHAASLTYIWDNVYQYDKEFCLHLSKYPSRSWTVTLQHAWNLKMKEKLHENRGRSFQNSNNNNRTLARNGSNEPCRRYNRGKLNFGSSCKYDHKCLYCFKFGHGALNCWKFQADRDHKSQSFNQRRDQSRDSRDFNRRASTPDKRHSPLGKESGTVSHKKDN